MNASIAEAIQAVERCIEELYNQAAEITDDYLSFVDGVDAAGVVLSVVTDDD